MAVGKNLEKLFSLENKVIVLTGAAGGIGSVLAKGLAGAGGDMVLCDVAMDPLHQVEKEIVDNGDRAKSFELDIMNIESIKTFVDTVIAEYGKIDVLINCAGINKREGFLDVEESTYDKLMGINLKGVFFLSQEVAKHMIKVKRGNIINMSSHNAVGMLGGCSVYGATKSALTALTRSMAVEWAQYGIRANAIAPGHIITPLTTVTWEHPERSQYLKERIAMERPGTPEEVLGLTVMLASDSSSYMSGMMYHIDGGCLAGGKPWPYDTKY
ncbi:MAG: short-chain dehydrogenase/reductase [Clostridia bacterium]|jgi:NAD(P)-dependent dehydrogenase (short-subunit alcohol dehydrogenase family)|nr:short-chain dehydrogenase/reductase [Clostridia bacterium]